KQMWGQVDSGGCFRQTTSPPRGEHGRPDQTPTKARGCGSEVSTKVRNYPRAVGTIQRLRTVLRLNLPPNVRTMSTELVALLSCFAAIALFFLFIEIGRP